MHMLIGGLQKVSLSDFPGKIAAIVFTRGCNFRCPYCHNPELVDPARFIDTLEEKTIVRFLKTRITKLQGIVVTGGEPTVHPDLPDFLERLKKMGYLVKLDTNGSHPQMLEEVFNGKLVDYCAMDVKAVPDSYSRITRISMDQRKIASSIELIKSSRIAHEFRTTYVDTLLSSDDMLTIGGLVKGSRFVLQRYKRTKNLDAQYLGNPDSTEAALMKVQARLAAAGIPCEIG